MVDCIFNACIMYIYIYVYMGDWMHEQGNVTQDWSAGLSLVTLADIH